MSRRAQTHRHMEMLGDIGGIMGAMKNISVMETHKLARFLAHQHRVLASIEAAAADLLQHHPDIGALTAPRASSVVVAIGSQRGFCGDFNETMAHAIRAHWSRAAGESAGVVVVGRRLATRLGKDPRILVSLDGPGVVEEVQPVLVRLMNALSEIQGRQEWIGPLPVTVYAHREGENEPGERSILPAPNSTRAAARFSHPPLLHGEPSVFFTELTRHYLWAQMHDVFYGSLMAENRRRLQHMEGAMQRMDERIEKLRRNYNRLRQEEITEEIEVIMLSSDALILRSQ